MNILKIKSGSKTYDFRFALHSSKSSLLSWFTSAVFRAFWMSTIFSRLKESRSNIFWYPYRRKLPLAHYFLPLMQALIAWCSFSRWHDLPRTAKWNRRSRSSCLHAHNFRRKWATGQIKVSWGRPRAFGRRQFQVQ